MTVPIQDRPTDTLREQVIDQLIMNYAHGVISEAAFERRLGIAMESQDNQEIIDQIKDLEMKVDDDFIKSKRANLGINHASAPVEEEERLTSILGSSERSGRWQVPKRIKVYSLLGGTNLDFTDAEFFHPNVTIDVTCILGNETIYVPENVNVVSKAFSVMGSVENSAPSISTRNAPTITIEGTVIMGGIEVTVKRTIKEKFQAFAENFKQMLQ
ncbi:MAG: cell wall-active antibiotics response protein [Kangiellaceae bacterium]|nr:cell wall-active antibiotics response protein [Kangiellaceae bacterium]MCW8999969.1 cell wall-active antibiotics response protein [Kangiellaceae bacterium]